MKTKNIVLASVLVLAGVPTAGPAFAGSESGDGHTPVAFCFQGHVIIPDANSGDAHLSNGAVPIPWSEDLKKGDWCGYPSNPPATEPPVKEDVIIGSSQVITYECAGTVTYRVATTTVSWQSGREETTVTKEAVVDGAEVIDGCKLVPGDLPVKPQEPVVAAPEQPVAPAAPVDVPVAQTVPVTAPVAPLANSGSVPVSSTETAPTELAYTGFNWGVFLLGSALLGLGVVAVRSVRKA